MNGWTVFQPFKMAEVTTYHVEAQLSGSTGMVFMSKKKWDTLSPAVKKVLESNSGEAQSRAFGAFWDRINEEGERAGDVEWEFFDSITEGNVCHAPLNEIEASKIKT